VIKQIKFKAALKNCFEAIKNIRLIEEDGLIRLNLRSKFLAWHSIIQRTSDLRIRYDFLNEKTNNIVVSNTFKYWYQEYYYHMLERRVSLPFASKLMVKKAFK